MQHRNITIYPLEEDKAGGAVTGTHVITMLEASNGNVIVLVQRELEFSSV